MKLYTAIVKEIKEQKKFSAYDITKSLRKKSNANLIVIDDVTLVTKLSGNYLDIDSSDVNNIVRDIYENKILDLTRVQSAGYFTYSLNGAVTQSTTNTNPTLAAHLAQVARVAPTWAATQASKANVLLGWSKSERHNIYTKVASYVSNKRKNKEAITLKGINSAVKITGLTVNDLNDVCNKLGYKVVKKNPVSLSEVK